MKSTISIICSIETNLINIEKYNTLIDLTKRIMFKNKCEATCKCRIVHRDLFMHDDRFEFEFNFDCLESYQSIKDILNHPTEIWLHCDSEDGFVQLMFSGFELGHLVEVFDDFEVYYDPLTLAIIDDDESVYLA